MDDQTQGLPAGTTFVIYNIGTDVPVTPADPLPPLPEIPQGSLVIIQGQAPPWRYGQAIIMAWRSPWGGIAIYDPEIGNLCIAGYAEIFNKGQIYAL